MLETPLTRAAWCRMAEDTTCELCADPTPAIALRCDPDRGWDDGLCLACWMLNQPQPPSLPEPEAFALGSAGGLPPLSQEAILQQQMLNQYALQQYALQWQAQQQARLTHGLGGVSPSGQASGLFGGGLGGAS